MRSERRVIFIGGRGLGAHCLRSILKTGARITCVIARSDEALSVGHSDTVASIALDMGLPCIWPEDLKDSSLANWVAEHSPEIGFCAMYPSVLPGALLAIPKQGIFNLHGAPLPTYRGCLGHAWAIINGDSTYGVTIHRMTEQLDAGPIIAESSFDIAADETGASLHKKAVAEAASIFDRCVERILDGEFEESSQEAVSARYYSKSVPFDGVVQWSWSADELDRFIRGMQFPGVPQPHTFLGDTRIHVLSASPLRENHSGARCLPGSVVDVGPAGASVGTTNGCVLLESVLVRPFGGGEYTLQGEELRRICARGTRFGR